MTQKPLEQPTNAQVVAMTLVVIDIATGERGLVQVPDQRLMRERQFLESVGVELDDRRVIDLLEQVLPIGSYSGRSTF
jgi:hypothetical protein